MAGMAGMAGMVERQKEWQNRSGYISVLGLFLVFSHLTLFVIYRCFGKCCWCWFLKPLAGMAGTAERMVEQKWLYKCLGIILGVFPSDLVCDLSLFWEMLLVLVFNTFSGNGQMAEIMAEWQNGRNGYIHTIYGTR